MEEKKEKRSPGRTVGASGNGDQKIAGGARAELRANRGVVGRVPDRSAADFDAYTFERLVSALERV